MPKRRPILRGPFSYFIHQTLYFKKRLNHAIHSIEKSKNEGFYRLFDPNFSRYAIESTMSEP
jgi:hypothetical protein